MTDFDINALGESLNRLVKLEIDLGRARTIEAAYEVFSQYRVTFAIADQVGLSPEHQSCLLTLLALANKFCLGGAFVFGKLDVPLVTPLPFSASLQDAVEALGGHLTTAIDPDHPVVVLGDVPEASFPPTALRCTFEGWRGGVVPVASNLQLSEKDAIGPAVALSAALAVNEVFMLLRGESSEAGYRPVGASLWDVEATAGWLDPTSDGPKLHVLPSGIWLAGLGHLGQAYAWVLCLLPYARPNDLSLVLQDFDCVTEATISTGMVATPSTIGWRKTRMLSRFLEHRGYRTQLIERRFGANATINDDEPRILIAGFDNALARQHLEAPGYALVIDAGLGRGSDDFQAIRLHRFPARRKAADIWSHAETVSNPTTDLPAYNDLESRGLDQCGVTLLAERAVGAPFVGCTAAALAVSEILRALHDGPCYSAIDLNLRSPGHWFAAKFKPHDVTNPGITTNIAQRAK